MTILSVVLFVLGVVLLLLGFNSLALYRSNIPRQHQGSAGAKSVALLVTGALLMGAGLTLFIVRAVASP